MNFLIKTRNFSFTKLHLKISSAKWRPFWVFLLTQSYICHSGLVPASVWCMKWFPQGSWSHFRPHQTVSRAATLIARFLGPIWGPSGADRTQVGPMLTPWTLLSGSFPINQCPDGEVTTSVRYELLTIWALRKPTILLTEDGANSFWKIIIQTAEGHPPVYNQTVTQNIKYYRRCKTRRCP